MNKLGDYLKELRGSMSLRQFASVCDISHTHLDSLEKGVDPRTGKPVRVTTDTLKKISDNLHVDYLFLAALAEEDDLGGFIAFSTEECVVIGRRISEIASEKGVPIENVLNSIGISAKDAREMQDGLYPFTVGTLTQVADAMETPIDYFLKGTKKDTSSEVSDEDIMFALFDGAKIDEITPEMFEEVKSFALFVRDKKRREQDAKEQEAKKDGND
ncbi:helix-turn-helix domain-containing protein [Oscillospiraceae bacterium OttesenSCG-928-G22]|nr:helix-turn-helix domain-containing protein [Oscillospiraceae bacterium OttesenSCG-928-G22]